MIAVPAEKLENVSSFQNDAALKTMPSFYIVQPFYYKDHIESFINILNRLYFNTIDLKV